MASLVSVIGVHPVEADEPVHLIELEIEGPIDEFDFGELLQAVPGQPRSDWQVAYDEQILVQEVGRTRAVFFFHNLDIDLPLKTSFGLVRLPLATSIPDHLSIIEYDAP